MNQKEIWRDIFGYKGLYQVSNLGRVKSLKRKNRRETKILKNLKAGHGYLQVALSKDGTSVLFRINILVAMAFLNHKPQRGKIVVDHINNIRSDNRLSNLQVITHRQNLTKDKKNKTSKYTGVSKNKSTNKWYSCITIGKKCYSLGYYEKEEDAARAYQNKLKTLI